MKGRMIRNFIKILFVIEVLIAAIQINAVNADAKSKKNKVAFTADEAVPYLGDYCVSKLKKNKNIISTTFKSTDKEVATVKKISNRKVRIDGVGSGFCDVVATVKVKTKKGIKTKKARIDVYVFPDNDYIEEAPVKKNELNLETDKNNQIVLPKIDALKGKSATERIEYLRTVLKDGATWGNEKEYTWTADNRKTHACGAFGAIMSDLVYGKDAKIEKIGFPEFNEIQVGDYVVVATPGSETENGTFKHTHAIFVTEVHNGYIVYANGNDGGKIKWDCIDDDYGWLYLMVYRRA